MKLVTEILGGPQTETVKRRAPNRKVFTTGSGKRNVRKAKPWQVPTAPNYSKSP